MASKTGNLLTEDQRKELVHELQKHGELMGDYGSTKRPSLQKVTNVESDGNQTNTNSQSFNDDDEKELSAPEDDTATTNASSTVEVTRQAETASGNSGQATVHDASDAASMSATVNIESFGTGCLACGADDDHANLLLCEGCNAEYHTYCLDPPLRAVPTGDWYCSRCKSELTPYDDDGLERLVSALAPSFTSRFGEVCWAQGGTGFGWWPGFIYDPRLTIGNARNLARKNLGKRHLVYFFECHDAPFSVLTSAKITRWEDGLMEDFHLGKTARAAGKLRTQNFQQALQAATVEAGKPIEMRMDWNHTDQPQILPSPQKRKITSRKRPLNALDSSGGTTAAKKSSSSEHCKEPQRLRGFPLLSEVSLSLDPQQVSTRRNLNRALETLAGVAKIETNTIVEPAEDGELVVRLLKKVCLPVEGNVIDHSKGESTASPTPAKNVGFVKLESRKSSSFADARITIQRDLVPDVLSTSEEWKFFVPGLGPVSTKQETSLGPILSFLRRTTTDHNLGDGTMLHPLKVFIVASEAET